MCVCVCGGGGGHHLLLFECRGDIMIHVGDIMSTVEVFSTMEVLN